MSETDRRTDGRKISTDPAIGQTVCGENNENAKKNSGFAFVTFTRGEQDRSTNAYYLLGPLVLMLSHRRFELTVERAL
jgi:hypothetical protein